MEIILYDDVLPNFFFNLKKNITIFNLYMDSTK